MRLLYLTWSHLPLRLERAARTLPEGPVVLGGQPWETGTVLDCDPLARQHGVRRGMPLGTAHKLAPEAAFLAPDRTAYRAAMETALDALSAFAPYVEGAADPDDEAFGSAYLGIEGLGRLWGDEPTLLERVAGALEPLLPGPPRAGIGGSRTAARIAAVVARDRLPGSDLVWGAVPVGAPAEEAAFLAPLSVDFLPASGEARERLRLFGLRAIGDLARLDRAAVVARFGAEGGFLHDLANGRDERPLVPRRPPERLRAEAELEPPVEQVEPLRFVLHRLADVLCEQLASRGRGTTLARLELSLEGGAPLVLAQALPAPTARSEVIERLLLARLDVQPPGRPVGRVALELDGGSVARGEQLGLFSPRRARAGRLDWQLADLAIRFGPDRVLRARLVDPDARLPEERAAWTPAVVTGASVAPSRDTGDAT